MGSAAAIDVAAGFISAVAPGPHKTNAIYKTVRDEIGERRPTYDMLIKLADYFDVSLDYLVGRTDNPNVNK